MSIIFNIIGQYVLNVPEIDKRVGSVILGKNPFDVIRSKYAPTDLFVSILQKIYVIVTTNESWLSLIFNGG